MAEESEIETAAAAINGNTSTTITTNSEPIWNYAWDDKLCKTTLKLFKPTVYTPPILSLQEARDPDRYYVCPVEGCGKFFKKIYGAQFRIHLKRHLPECEKPFKCDHPTCTRAFIRYDELKCHKRGHTGEKPYECEQCGKRFTRTCHLNKHLRIHIKEAKKKMPPEEFSDDDWSDDMLENAKSQSKSTEKRHKCPVKGCGMAFVMPYGLKRHSWTHTKVKTFECDKCKKTFLRKDHLHKHIKTHFGNDHRAKGAKMSSGEDSSDDGSDGTSDFDFSDSSSNSLVPTNSDVPVKHETDTDTETDLGNLFEEGQRREIGEIKDETKNISKSSLSSYLKETKVEEDVSVDSLTATIDLKSNANLLNSHHPIKLEVPVKQEIDTEAETIEPYIKKNIEEDDGAYISASANDLNSNDISFISHLPVKLPVKQEIYSEGLTSEFEEGDQYKSTDKSNESQIIAPSYLSELNSWEEPTSIETPIHRIAFPIAEKNAVNNLEYNDNSLSEHLPTNLEVFVKKEFEIDADASEYHYELEDGTQYKNKDITHESQITNSSYLSELNSWDKPTSMSAAIHHSVQAISEKSPVNNFDYNDIQSSEYCPTNLEVSVKKEIETDAEATEYQYRFEEGNQYRSLEMTYGSQIIAPPYQPELNSPNEPVANKKNVKSKSKSTEKLHKCSVEGCNKAFRAPYGLKRHSWTHTKVKTLECDQCKKTFLRKDHLSKHMKTHPSPIATIKSSLTVTPNHKTDNRLLTLMQETTRKMSSKGVTGDDGSDATIGFESNDSKSSSLITSISDVPVNQELYKHTGSNEDHRFSKDHLNEIEEIKFEPENITEYSIPAFYAAGLHLQVNEKKLDEVVDADRSIAANDFESNNTPSSSHFPIIFDVTVKQDIDADGKFKCIDASHESEIIAPLHLPSSDAPTSVPVKQETDAEAEKSEYHHRSEEERYKSIDSRHESETIAPPNLHDLKSSDAPTSVPVKQEIDAEAEKSQYHQPFEEDQYKSIDASHESEIFAPPYIPSSDDLTSVPVKQEIDGEAKKTEYHHRSEEVEPPYLHTPASVKEDRYKSIDSRYDSDSPPILHHLNSSEDPIAVPLKQEIYAEEEKSQYHPRFEEDQYKSIDTRDESEIIAHPYLPDLNSSDEPTSMSAAIHRLAFPIAKKNVKSKSKPTEKQFKCPEESCGMAFRVPYGLKRHSWTHTREKSFECDQCKKRFLRKDHLSKHMKTHSRTPMIQS